MLLRLDRTAMPLDATHQTKGATGHRISQSQHRAIYSIVQSGPAAAFKLKVPHLLLEVSVAEEGARLDIECAVPVATAEHLTCQARVVSSLRSGDTSCPK